MEENKKNEHVILHLNERRFLDALSLKLRAPMANLMAYINALRFNFEGSLSEKQREILIKIWDSTCGVSDNFEKLSALVHITTQKKHVGKIKLNLKNHLEESLGKLMKIFKNRVSDRRVEFSLYFSPEENAPDVEIHPEFLELAIKNLIENAIKFTEKNPVKVDIRVNFTPDDTEIRVTDNGRGIPAEEQEKIFKQFYRTDNCQTGTSGEVRMGLMLVTEIIQLHGGILGVESKPERGSTFWFKIPNRQGKGLVDQT